MLTCVLDQQVYLGEQYVNNLTLSDVTFLVEGQTFHAHRIALLASSDTFRAMFDGHYKEKEASTIPIPNIRYCVFESMMRCIYTGEIPSSHAAVPPNVLGGGASFMDRLCGDLLVSQVAACLTLQVPPVQRCSASPQYGSFGLEPCCVDFAMTGELPAAVHQQDSVAGQPSEPCGPSHACISDQWHVSVQAAWTWRLMWRRSCCRQQTSTCWSP